MTKRGGTEYYWDSQDHLTKVYDGSKTVQYKYDLMGRRVAKKVDSWDWNWYFYDGLKVIAEGTTTQTRTYYTNSPAVIGGIICRGGGQFYHYDRLGNVVAVTTNYDGLISELYTMDAFGNLLQSGDNSYGYCGWTSLSQPYLLTTKEFDSDIGLYYFNARWYDPTTVTLGSPATHTFTILDNDPPPTVGFVQVTGKVPESIGLARIPVRLTAQSEKTVTVSYSTANGTALAGRDYLTTSGVLTFTALHTTATVTVRILATHQRGTHKTLQINLTNPQNATLGTRAHTLTIEGETPATRWFLYR